VITISRCSCFLVVLMTLLPKDGAKDALRAHSTYGTVGKFGRGASGIPIGRYPSGRAFGCTGTTPAARFRHSASIANAKGGGGHFAASPVVA
jgi:hypothetical protein